MTTTEQAHQFLQYLAPDGGLTEQGRRATVDLSALRSRYRDMALGRRLDQQAYLLQRQGQLGLWLMSLGQEAAQVGAVRALRETDWIFPSYREHVAGLCRGLGPEHLLPQWRGTVHSGWDPAEFRFHITSLVLGTQCLHATGYAMGVQLDEADEVVLVFVGDGATSQGDVNEALNWAATVSAPIIFFCQNNQWAISTPTDRQFHSPLHERASGFGLRSFHVDGNDVLAVEAATREAADGARSGRGAAFIEAATFRMSGHSTSDEPRRYRDEELTRLWQQRDPLARVENFLRERGVGDDFFATVEAESEQLGARTRELCATLPDPKLADLFDTAYSDPHPLMRTQQDRVRILAARADDGGR